MDKIEKQFVLETYDSGQSAPRVVEADWLSLFNASRFFSLHAAGRRGRYFVFCDGTTGEVLACAHFTETIPGHFISPLRGTFGGFESSSTDLSLLEEFVDGIEKSLVEIGAKSIEVALKPLAHDPALGSCLFNVLARRGYKTSVCDLSYSMTIDEGAISDRMHCNNQRKLRKCQREGFRFEECESPLARSAAYDAVAANRAAKGYSISMTREQLEEMTELFPKRFHYFTVCNAESVIAGAVCIALNPRVLYVFYWGDIPGYNVFSPTVLLADGIYGFARRNGFRLLDVGRSTSDSLPNYGLILFKETLGFEASLKLTFRKEL